MEGTTILTTSSASGISVGDTLRISMLKPTLVLRGYGVWLSSPVKIQPGWVWSALARTLCYRKMAWLPDWFVEVFVFLSRYLYGRVRFSWPLCIRRYNPYEGVYRVTCVSGDTLTLDAPYGDPRVVCRVRSG
jgi:hypothetical protein